MYARKVPADIAAGTERVLRTPAIRQAAFLLFSGVHGVVGSFLGDVDIVGVALLQAGAGDADELAVGAQLFNIVGAAVAHA